MLNLGERRWYGDVCLKWQGKRSTLVLCRSYGSFASKQRQQAAAAVTAAGPSNNSPEIQVVAPEHGKAG